MKEFIEKLIGRLGEQQAEAEDEMHRLRSGDYTLPCSYDITDIKEIARESFKESIQIVNQLAEEYKDDEEQGLLLRLPCKIGDELWWYDAYGDLRTSKVNSMFVEFGIDGIVIETLICNIYANDIGKTVFLTKEEAEQTLKQIGE